MAVPTAVRRRSATRQDYVDLLTAIHANGRGVRALFEALEASEKRTAAKFDRLEARVTYLFVRVEKRLDRIERKLDAVVQAVGANVD
ncbi:MAG: hypothetical protein OXH75_06005 [Acidobacteria bacterium]|nr:hypothetical protein [Acidobacteriota bacterium]